MLLERYIYLVLSSWLVTHTVSSGPLQKKRTLVLQFISIEKIAQFNRFWPSKERHLFNSMTNLSVYITFPHIDAPEVARSMIKEHKWVYLGKHIHAHMFAQGDIVEYVTPYGTQMFLQAVIVHLPRYFLNLRPAPPINARCGKQRPAWPLSYAMYSGAVFSYHLLQLPLLRLYDYVLKVDADIGFKQDMPYDIGTQMERRGCIIAHTSIYKSTLCEADSTVALSQYLSKSNRTLSRVNKRWCSYLNNRVRYYFYGNFIGLKTSFIHAHDVVKLAEYLYEEWDRGYFLHRWGDQAPFTMYLCLMANSNAKIHNSSLLCDFSLLRHKVFEHGPLQ